MLREKTIVTMAHMANGVMGIAIWDSGHGFAQLHGFWIHSRLLAHFG